MPVVAIVGASNSPNKFGHRAVRAYRRQGWTVIPVNPNERVVDGLAAVPDVEAIPGPIDRVALYVPSEVGIKLLPGIARKAPPELFVNPGAESDALLAEAERLGLSVIQACAIVDIGETPWA